MEADRGGYRLLEEIPGPEEYANLRTAAGLGERTVTAAEIGLPNSLYAVCVRQEDTLVGMARVVGDGGCNYEIVDMAVHPDHQRRGLGTRMMAALMAYLETNAPETAYVSLIADDFAPRLYERFGFRPVAPRSIGMARRM